MMAATVGELRAMSDAELAGALSGARQELFNLRFQMATRKLTNHNRLGEVRREIARILTIGASRRG